jgi:hypothetical protein
VIDGRVEHLGTRISGITAIHIHSIHSMLAVQPGSTSQVRTTHTLAALIQPNDLA